MIKKGFSLVEIMLVVSIIFILASIVVMAGNSAKAVARDNQRKADMSLLQLKLEAYREQYGNYPAELEDLDVNGFVLPTDPSTKELYSYIPLSFTADPINTCGASYYLFANLENNFSSTAQHAARNDSLSSCLVGVELPDDSDLSKIYDVTSPK